MIGTMRRAFLFLALCTAGCGALLGIEPGSPELEGDDGSTGVVEASTSNDGAIDAITAEDSGDAGLPTDSGPTGIPCLGAQLDAFFCDGFESTALSPAWTPILIGNGATFATTTQYFAQGARGGLSRFSPMPDNGTARLAWKRPGGSGPIAFQFALYVMSDPWSVGQDVPVAALRGGANAVQVYFVPDGNDANGTLQLRFQIGPATPAFSLGASKLNAWQCIELVHDGANLTTYVGSALAGTAPVPVAFDTAEIGFDWPYTGNPGAAKAFAYDNVAIGPARLGCVAN